MDNGKLFSVVTGMFVGVIILSNILAVKMVQLGPFVFDGGTLLFPLSYIFGDVLTEVYGFKASRKTIWTGFVMLIVMSLNIWIIALLPSESSWTFQNDFNNILTPIPRIVIASICGYFIGEYFNSVVLSRMKILTKGKWLWLRTIGSTIIGQLFDTAVFVFIAFSFTYSWHILFIMIISNYLFKTCIEIAFTPLTYKVVNFIKSIENIDVYDYNEKYSPLPEKLK